MRQYLAESTPQDFEKILCWLDKIANTKINNYRFIVANGDLIGHVGLKAISEDWSVAEIAVVIGDKSYWSQGIGSHVVKNTLKLAHASYIRELRADICPEHLGSIKLFQNLGFIKISSTPYLDTYLLKL